MKQRPRQDAHQSNISGLLSYQHALSYREDNSRLKGVAAKPNSKVPSFLYWLSFYKVKKFYYSKGYFKLKFY